MARANFKYTGGYIAKIKSRDSERFVSMSQDADGSGSNKGVYFAAADWDFMKDGRLRADLQYGVDAYNTFYVDASCPSNFGERTRLTLGAQYFPQRSVGDAQIGDFSTWGAGLQAVGPRALRRAPVVHAHRHRFRHAEPLWRPSVVPEPAGGAFQLGGRARLGLRRQRPLRRTSAPRA